MPNQMLRQSRLFQFPFPILCRDVGVRDLSVQRGRVIPGDRVHVLRLGTGELVYPAQMRPGFGQDGSDDPCDIRRRDRRGLALPERQFDAVPIADARSGEGQEEPFQEDGRPDGDDGQAGPRERLLAEPVLPLLKTRGGVPGRSPTPASFRSWSSVGYSMIWSARPSTDCGIVRLSALAVLRLMTSSNLVGCCTGNSAGFAPRRIRSMYPAARLDISARLAPYAMRPPNST